MTRYRSGIMLVTTPLIGKLRAHPRLWAYRQIKRGRFGPVVEGPRGALLVELGRVEASQGFPFSPSQLAAAGLPQIEEEMANE